MALIRFFKVPKHSKFEHKPRYYDPLKEEREARHKRLKDIKSGDREAIKQRMRSRMRKGYVNSSKFRSGSVRRSNFILLGVIVVLCLFAYYFIQFQLPQIMEQFY